MRIPKSVIYILLGIYQICQCSALIYDIPCNTNDDCNTLDVCVKQSFTPTVYGASNMNVFCQLYYYAGGGGTSKLCNVKGHVNPTGINGISCRDLDCRAGSYMFLGQWGVECKACPSNFVCYGGVLPMCPIGYNCSAGLPYTCLPGYWGINSTCNECTDCAQGFYAISKCTTTENTRCVPDCPINSNKSDLYAGYRCECDLSKGVYIYDAISNECKSCPENRFCPAQLQAIPCPAGTYRPEDTLPADKCLNCSNAPLVGEYVWTNQSTCTYECKENFYRYSLDDYTSMCLECTQNFSCTSGQTAPNCPTKCSPGMYVPRCAQGSNDDQVCTTCPSKPQGATWTSLCGFACNTGTYYNSTSKLCNTCLFPVCPPGQNASKCITDKGSVCEACPERPLNGPYTWSNTTSCIFLCSGSTYYNRTNNQTCQDCREGTYRSSSTSCSNCATSPCLAGTYRTICGVGEISDSVCAQCPNAPIDGLFNWTSGCNFTCSDGYYLDGNKCIVCSKPVCIPGKYATSCTRTANSVCTACTNQPATGSITYITSCNFTCNDNTFFNASDNSCAACPRDTYRSTPTTCSKCTLDQCEAGLNRSLCSAGSVSDAQCVPCANSPKSGLFDWTSGCAFTCKYGLYLNRSLNSCLPCSMPKCIHAGQYASPCTENGISQCVNCTGPAIGEYEWTSGCNFTCLGASYYTATDNSCRPCANGMYASSQTACTECSTTLRCTPGTKQAPCTNRADSYCKACENAPEEGSFNWTDGCSFTCNDGLYYSTSRNKCVLCTLPECQPGQTPNPCTDNNNTPGCTACPNSAVSGPFVWTERCAFACINNTFLLNGTNCTRCTPQCPNGSFVSAPCNATADTRCAVCNVIPKPPGSFYWIGECNFKCKTGLIWNSTHCEDEATVDMVIVSTKTEINFNNTVEEVCSKLDIITKAVVQAMEAIYSVPFTGNVTAVNNVTVDIACAVSNSSEEFENSNTTLDNNATKRRLLRAAPARSSGASVISSATRGVPKSGTSTNAGSANQNIQANLKGSTLDPTGMISSSEYKSIQKGAQQKSNLDGSVIGGIVGGVVGVLIICFASYCCYYRQGTQETPRNSSINTLARMQGPPAEIRLKLMPCIRKNIIQKKPY